MALSMLVLLAGGGALIGFLLSVLGAGGSILLLPLLTSGAGLPTDAAIALSLLIVIVLASGNAMAALKRRRVAFRPALILGVPALAGSWVGALLARAGHLSDAAQLGVFAVAALVASWLLMRQPIAGNSGIRSVPGGNQAGLLALQGLLVGLLTGVAGVGGGFALVPALVLLAGLPISIASGTSLVLIVLNSTVALLATGVWPAEQLPMVPPLLAGGIIGALVGQQLAPRLREAQLRRGFAALLVGSSILTAFEAMETHRGEAAPGPILSSHSPPHNGSAARPASRWDTTST
ncbi:MAG: sulfite exporter TauE/SafE family protein [Cyanobacteriota bacterium]|nr:sulfite exporter TauE/SafE family protein [Cyanobacteriota bacterium]